MDGGELLDHLRNLVGRECEHLGDRCTLLDVLWGEGVVVLRVELTVPPIQPDQYGRPSFRTQELREIPIFGEGRKTCSEELLDLFSRMGNAAICG